ncbi:hypothetical protein QBD01_002206 [Ochrobactrum sp. 19YEA23]|nr:hypothetical protein [Ochrobactrum sp. 19YEA23]
MVFNAVIDIILHRGLVLNTLATYIAFIGIA